MLTFREQRFVLPQVNPRVAITGPTLTVRRVQARRRGVLCIEYGRFMEIGVLTTRLHLRVLNRIVPRILLDSTPHNI